MALLIGSVETTPVANGATFIARVVTVTTAGTPVQAPTFAIPDSFGVAVRAHRDNGVKILYVAPSSADVIDATKRISLGKGESMVLKVNNVDDIWFDSSVNGTKAEVLVEQA